jgi:hypothetical protein
MELIASRNIKEVFSVKGGDVLEVEILYPVRKPRCSQRG